jgi:hypothetical protein
MIKRGIIAFLVVSFCASPSTVFAISGYAAGSAAGADIKHQLDTPEEVNARISQPLTSENTPMKTFGPEGDAQSFNAQLTAPSTDSFMEIFAQPGGSGDLATLIIKQDTTFDGNYNYVWTSPRIVSGVCANGFISCTAGTWDNCRYYTWEVTDQLKVRIQELTSITGLAGCFCINSSCGSNLAWTNMQYVLSTLGSGVVGFIQEKNSRVVVTGVDTSMTHATYYGQQTSEIGAAQSGSGVYFSGTTNPGDVYHAGNFSADDEVMTQSTDPDSPYNLIANSYASRQLPKESNSCVVKRTIEFDGSDQPYVSTMETCSSLDLTDCELFSEFICDYNGGNCVHSYRNEAGTGLTPVSNNVSLSSPGGVSYTFTTNGVKIKAVRKNVSPYVTTVLNSGSSLWWSIKRQYMCDTGVTIDPSDASSRTVGVTNTVDLQGSTLKYVDYGSEYDVNLRLGEEHSPCEKACKVTKPITKTELGADVGTWDIQKSVASEQVYYRTCLEDVCPKKDGETVVVDCSCLNDFAEATSVMQTMESASKDMICSQF